MPTLVWRKDSGDQAGRAYEGLIRPARTTLLTVQQCVAFGGEGGEGGFVPGLFAGAFFWFRTGKKEKWKGPGSEPPKPPKPPSSVFHFRVRGRLCRHLPAAISVQHPRHFHCGEVGCAEVDDAVDVLAEPLPEHAGVNCSAATCDHEEGGAKGGMGMGAHVAPLARR